MRAVTGGGKRWSLGARSWEVGGIGFGWAGLRDCPNRFADYVPRSRVSGPFN